MRYYKCKLCYMEAVKDDPDDHRASRGTAEGGGDTELSGMGYRRDGREMMEKEKKEKTG